MRQGGGETWRIIDEARWRGELDDFSRGKEGLGAGLLMGQEGRL